jgi:hypothetical protein
MPCCKKKTLRVQIKNLLRHKDNSHPICREGQAWHCWTLSFAQAWQRNIHLRTNRRLSAEKNFWTLFFSPGLHTQDTETKDRLPFAAEPQKLFHMLDTHTHKQAFLTPSHLSNIFLSIVQYFNRTLYLIQITGFRDAKQKPSPEVQSNVMLRFQPVNSPDGFLKEQHRHRT